jgi:hypothetical protein
VCLFTRSESARSRDGPRSIKQNHTAEKLTSNYTSPSLRSENDRNSNEQVSDDLKSVRERIAVVRKELELERQRQALRRAPDMVLMCALTEALMDRHNNVWHVRLNWFLKRADVKMYRMRSLVQIMRMYLFMIMCVW